MNMCVSLLNDTHTKSSAAVGFCNLLYTSIATGFATIFAIRSCLFDFVGTATLALCKISLRSTTLRVLSFTSMMVVAGGKYNGKD